MIMTQQRIIGDLRHLLHNDAPAGTVTGTGSTTSSTPTPGTGTPNPGRATRHVRTGVHARVLTVCGSRTRPAWL